MIYGPNGEVILEGTKQLRYARHGVVVSQYKAAISAIDAAWTEERKPIFDFVLEHVASSKSINRLDRQPAFLSVVELRTDKIARIALKDSLFVIDADFKDDILSGLNVLADYSLSSAIVAKISPLYASKMLDELVFDNTQPVQQPNQQ